MHAVKFLDILYTEVKSLAILVYFGLNLVAIATSLVPLKIQITYLNSHTPKASIHTVKFLDILYRSEITAIFC